MGTQRWFAPGYFAPGWFDPNWFGGATPASTGSWFARGWFARGWFANGWFAGNITRPPQKWFASNWFARGWFADGWFGGGPLATGHAVGSIALSLSGVSSAVTGSFFKATFTGSVGVGLDGVSASFVAVTAQVENFDLSISVTPTGHSTEYPGFAGIALSTLDDLTGLAVGTFRTVGAIDGQLGASLDGLTGAMLGTHTGPAGRTGFGPSATLDDIVATNWVGSVAAPGSNFGVIGALMDGLTAALVGTQNIPTRTGTLASGLDGIAGSIVGLSATSSIRIGSVDITLGGLSCVMIGIGPKFQTAAPKRIISDSSEKRIIKARGVH